MERPATERPIRAQAALSRNFPRSLSNGGYWMSFFGLQGGAGKNFGAAFSNARYRFV